MTVTLDDDLDAAVDKFRRDQAVPPSLASVARTALCDFLAARGYLASPRPLVLTPADRGSGDSLGSIDHDRVFARATEKA